MSNEQPTNVCTCCNKTNHGLTFDHPPSQSVNICSSCWDILETEKERDDALAARLDIYFTREEFLASN